MKTWIACTALALLCAGCAAPTASTTAAPAAAGGLVKVTPLGGIDGEFCPQDRALVFEDPNGTRVLFDPGRTVAGPNDPRLGKIDVVLVSHMHGDHAGDTHIPQPNAGTCQQPAVSVSAVPNTSAVNIALAKKAKIVTGSEMPNFFAAKLRANGGNPADSMLARFGGSVTVGGVRIATVSALHSNGVPPAYLANPEFAKFLADAGIVADVGPPTGYVLRFSNGLVAYLSGDTGITSDMEIVRTHYNARLAVINIGDGFTTGPVEAAYAINELVQPAAVIPSHANEVGTVGGKARPGSKTETFIKAVKAPSHIPLSGRTMAFDASGRCAAGC